MARPQEEDILDKDFKILTSLGCCSFGEVMLAQHLPTNTKVAVKALHKAHNEMEDIRSEVAILKSLQHPNIVTFFHAINTLRTTYIIMEYLAGKDLVTSIEEVGCLEEEEARPIFKQLASGVHFLHQRRIAHHDIKLENNLLGEGGEVKLCDFGLATQLVKGQMLQELWGSMPYWAPEILARRPYDGMAGDMWSLGVVLYALVTGQFPYRGSTLIEMYHHIITTRCSISHHLSTCCFNILARLLKVYVRFRLTSSQLMEQQWLGHIEEQVTPPAKEILPKVVEMMCNIGYTCEQVVACLKHPKLDNITATMKIIKFHLSSGHSSLQNIIPAVATSHADPMKRRHSKDALLMKRKSSVRLRAYTCPEVMHYSNDRVPYNSLPANTINPATADNVANRISEDGLSQKTVPDDCGLSCFYLPFAVEVPGSQMRKPMILT